MPSSAASDYIGRFAPSPTGPLHAGSLVAALASWLDAQAHGGQWLVRIEDVDTPRCVPGATELILQQLAQCGLHSDGPVLRQSERAVHYQTALDALIAQGLAYPCGCSRKDIEAAQSRQPARHSAAIYPGTCRPSPYGPGLQGKAARAWRLNIQAVREQKGLPAMTEWHDVQLGPQQQNVALDVGDFVLLRADGRKAFQTKRRASAGLVVPFARLERRCGAFGFVRAKRHCATGACELGSAVVNALISRWIGAEATAGGDPLQFALLHHPLRA